MYKEFPNHSPAEMRWVAYRHGITTEAFIVQDQLVGFSETRAGDRRGSSETGYQAFGVPLAVFGTESEVVRCASYQAVPGDAHGLTGQSTACILLGRNRICRKDGIGAVLKPRLGLEAVRVEDPLRMALVGVIEDAARVVTIGVEPEVLVTPPPPPPPPQPISNPARRTKESRFKEGPPSAGGSRRGAMHQAYRNDLMVQRFLMV